MSELEIKSIKDKICIEVSSDQTLIIVVVTHSDPSKNELTRVSCRKGFPLFGYLYDPQGDSYHIECVDYLPLGSVPVSFFQTMPGVGNWRARIPMPETVLRKHMSPLQKSDLCSFKASYKGPEYIFSYIQVIDCY